MARAELLRTQDDIKIINGNTGILLIAPHGRAKRPRYDINTDKLTYKIAERLKCSAIVNDIFKRTDIDFNDIVEASFHKTFIPAIKKFRVELGKARMKLKIEPLYLKENPPHKRK